MEAKWSDTNILKEISWKTGKAQKGAYLIINSL